MLLTYRTYRSSIVSQTSRLSGSDFDLLSDNEIIKLVNELKQQIKMLNLENEILEKTIMRLDPALMHGVYQALDYVTRRHSASSLATASYIKSQSSRFGLIDSLFSPSRMTCSSRVFSRKYDLSGKTGSIPFSSAPKINILEKAELVCIEMAVLDKKLNNAKIRATNKHALLKAKLEEIEIAVNDIEKAATMFDQEVLIDGWDNIAQRIPAEIWIRFMSEWLKNCDKQIGKLRLRSSTLNGQYLKMKNQIRVKAELNENLRPVDFDKLKIENSQCKIVIEQKVQQLEELKKITGDVNLNLAFHKEALMNQNNFLGKIKLRTTSRIRQTAELIKEKESIQAEVDLLTQRQKEIRKIKITYQVPNVMDYVYVKSVVTDLNHALKSLQNRLRIQQTALTATNKILRSLSAESYYF